MKKITTLICTLSILCFVSCEVTDFDLQDNPNELTPDSVDPNLVLNEIQIRFGQVMNDLSLNTDDVMRYEAMTDTYRDIADDGSLNGEWLDVYNIRENVKIIEGLADGDDNLAFHRGMARLLRAYSTATLVDYLGDIPFSEANDPDNFNPIADDDAAIYATILADIDLAITDLNNATVAPDTDVFYNGDAAKWVKLANSLKFRLLLNTGDVTGINALLSEDNLINSAEDDFQFQYSNIQTPVDSRHPYFERGYDPGTGQTEYIGNYFIWLLKDSKTVRDPRLRYYIYRQNNMDLTSSSCLGNPIFDFCYVGDFYWGRDHGDDRARPNDRFLKTVYGVYPAGGAFDADNPAASTTASTLELGGAGIFPVILSSYMDFLKAEAVLSLGSTGDALALLESGIRESMTKVLNFDPSVNGSPFAATSVDVDNYITAVLDEYGLAASNEDRLEIVVREYYIAAFGNSIEAYNAYRRTGLPTNLQIPIINESVPFPRTFSLPSNAVERNTSLNQRPITNQVFWDTNPAGFLQ